MVITKRNIHVICRLVYRYEWHRKSF